MQRSKLLVLGGMVLGAAATVFYVNLPTSSALAQQGGQQKQKEKRDTTPMNTKDITLDQAAAISMAAIEKAKEIDTKMDIAIVDAGGNLKSFARMDGAWIGSIDIAIKKARTARFFDMNTGEIGKLSQPGGPLYNIEHSNNGLITFPGGVPLKASDGTVIGAIGVSGSTVENDHTVAQAGADALK
ncbi:MAG TPA: heme-binding protein [Tepidisphaeraceae bacterium]|nr:heme-binding protein [Tepidisphaeraceae bacterium]